MKILIVEDEFLIGESLKLTLEDIGHEVVGPAPSSAEAKAAIAATLPNIAFVDTRLGSENSASVVADCQARGIAVIIMSGHARAQLPSYCEGLPLLNKPFMPDQVEAVLEEVQARRRA